MAETAPLPKVKPQLEVLCEEASHPVLPLGIRKRQMNSAGISVCFQFELPYVGVCIFLLLIVEILQDGWTSWQITQQVLIAGGMNLGLKATAAVVLECLISYLSAVFQTSRNCFLFSES